MSAPASPGLAPVPTAAGPSVGPSRVAILACAAVALGLAVRLAEFDRRSLWGDEVATFRRLSTPTTGALIDDLRRSPFPPLYYLTLRAWVGLWGLGDATIRSLPLILGAATLGATHLAWRPILGPRATAWAVGLLSLSAYHVSYSLDAKMYAAVWLASTVSCGSFLRVLFGARRRVWLVAHAASTAALPLISYVGVVAPAVQVVFLAARAGRLRRLDRVTGDLVASLVLATVPSLLWFPTAWEAATTRTGIEWIPPASPAAGLAGAYRVVAAFLTGFVPPASRAEAFSGRFPLAALQAACVAATGWALATSFRDGTGPRAWRRGRPVIQFLALWFVAPILGALAFSVGVYSLWGVPRFLTGCAPALLLWLAVALASLPTRRAAWLGLLVVVTNAAGLGLGWSSETRYPWRAIAGTIASFPVDPGGTIIAWPDDRPFEAECLDHALRRLDPSGDGRGRFFVPLAEARGAGVPFLLLDVDAPVPATSEALAGEGSSHDGRLIYAASTLDQTYTPILGPFSTRRVELWACDPTPTRAEPEPDRP